MQEDIEQRTVSVTVQASKLTGRVLKAAIAAVIQKMDRNANTPKVGRNSMKRLSGQGARREYHRSDRADSLFRAVRKETSGSLSH